jgi:hypothetical protein
MIISKLIHRLGSTSERTDGELHAGQLKLEDERELVLLNPNFLIEVLPPSTEAYERITF